MKNVKIPYAIAPPCPPVFSINWAVNQINELILHVTKVTKIKTYVTNKHILDFVDSYQIRLTMNEINPIKVMLIKNILK